MCHARIFCVVVTCLVLTKDTFSCGLQDQMTVVGGWLGMLLVLTICSFGATSISFVMEAGKR